MNLEVLNKHLFDALDRLSDKNLKGESLKEEINRASAVGGVANQIINGYALQLKAESMRNSAPQITQQSSEIIIPIEDLDKPRVVRDKNYYKSVKNA